MYLVATDADEYSLQRAETDEHYLVPSARSADYLPILKEIIRREGIDFVHAQNDVEIEVLSERRDELAAPMMLPDAETVRLCQDKFLSFAKWQAAGIKVPDTVLIDRDTDLASLLDRFDGAMWVRAISGAGGRGSLAVDSVELAKSWLDHQQLVGNGAWDGNFTAAELLEPQTVTWMSLWFNGELVVAQGRERLRWELARIAPSGVTGVTGVGVTHSASEVDEIARQAVLAIDPHPHGLFGVDMAYDRHGTAQPTEINIGRFFTTHQFFTALGLNMPHMFVKLAFGETVERPSQTLNPCPPDMLWIRGVDFEPVLTTVDAVERSRGRLADLQASLADQPSAR
jgi:predicted ATP-grasp superfamily ATP-dependent carboligase